MFINLACRSTKTLQEWGCRLYSLFVVQNYPNIILLKFISSSKFFHSQWRVVTFLGTSNQKQTTSSNPSKALNSSVCYALVQQTKKKRLFITLRKPCLIFKRVYFLSFVSCRLCRRNCAKSNKQYLLADAHPFASSFFCVTLKERTPPSIAKGFYHGIHFVTGAVGCECRDHLSFTSRVCK